MIDIPAAWCSQNIGRHAHFAVYVKVEKRHTHILCDLSSTPYIAVTGSDMRLFPEAHSN